MLRKVCRNGEFPVRIGADEPVSGGEPIVSGRIKIDSAPQQKLLTLRKQFMPPLLHLRMQTPVPGNLVITEVHQPCVGVRRVRPGSYLRITCNEPGEAKNQKKKFL